MFHHNRFWRLNHFRLRLNNWLRLSDWFWLRFYNGFWLHDRFWFNFFLNLFNRLLNHFFHFFCLFLSQRCLCRSTKVTHHSKVKFNTLGARCLATFCRIIKYRVKSPSVNRDSQATRNNPMSRGNHSFPRSSCVAKLTFVRPAKRT